MAEPATIAATVGAAFQGLRATVAGVAAWRSGKASEGDLHQLAVRYWGCVLFELDTNIRYLQMAVDHVNEAPDQQGAWPSLSLAFADALLPELARLAPLPIAVAQLGKLVGAVRQLGTMVALDQQAAATDSTARASTRATWETNARSYLPALRTGLAGMRDLVADQGRAAFGPQWQVLELSVLPTDLPGDPAAR